MQVQLVSVESSHFSAYCMTCGKTWGNGRSTASEGIEHASEHGHRVRLGRLQAEYWQPVHPEPGVDLKADYNRHQEWLEP